MKSSIKALAVGAFLVLSLTQQAHSALITDLVFKLSDSTADGNKLDAWTGWTGAGGFNESNASAALLIDNGLDFKSSLLDTWPTNMTNVRVSMYSQGSEVAYLNFNPTGTTKTSFFTASNVTSASWTDIGSGGYNYFSIAGHDSISRHWYINRNYGGCPSDVGHMVVIDRGTAGCSWESTRLGGNNRAFLYSAITTSTNWTSGSVGVADVFAVSITRRVPDNNIPAPATLALLGLGLAGVGMRSRQQRHSGPASFIC